MQETTGNEGGPSSGRPQEWQTVSIRQSRPARQQYPARSRYHQSNKQYSEFRHAADQAADECLFKLDHEAARYLNGQSPVGFTPSWRPYPKPDRATTTLPSIRHSLRDVLQLQEKLNEEPHGALPAVDRYVQDTQKYYESPYGPTSPMPRFPTSGQPTDGTNPPSTLNGPREDAPGSWSAR